MVRRRRNREGEGGEGVRGSRRQYRLEDKDNVSVNYSGQRGGLTVNSWEVNIHRPSHPYDKRA